MPLSIVVTGVVNLISFLLSIPLVGAGIWLATTSSTECVKFLEWPVIVIGLVILLVSLAGFFGACYRIPWLLYIYLVIMFFVILLLIIMVIFAFVVTKDGPAAENGRRNYNVQDYSPWLRNEVRSSSSWGKIRNCIQGAKICDKMNQDYRSAAAFYSANLSPVQSGCCIPPAICGYTIAGPTTWNNPTNVNAEEDCSRWSNDLGVLCYNCDSCRAAALANVKRSWRKVALISVLVLVALIVVYVVGCCAFHNSKTEDFIKAHEHPYLSRSWRRRHWFRR